jgi:acetylornithine deacetylase/succinyl-diaminopimelate desuccinylase-like protein
MSLTPYLRPRTALAALALTLGLAAAGCQTPDPESAPGGADERSSGSTDMAAPSPASFEFTTDDKFDASAIAAYTGDHAEVYAHIDANLDTHIGNLQRWMRQRSISAQNDGIQEMAELLRSDLEGMGFQEAELVPTDGHPGVWGYYDAGAEQTLLVYLMYDVQPVNLEDWESPPFEANLVDSELGTILMARGATNQKGPERAFFNAVQSIIETTGGLPVNLMVTAEGEEEIGSVHYPQIVDAYADRLAEADGALFPMNNQGAQGGMRMSMGVKGIIYMEVESKGGDWGGPENAEIHGSYKAIVDAPAWRLVQALSSMTSEDGNTILIPGYYDDVRPPTLEEQMLINGLVDGWDDAVQQETLGLDHWIDGLTGRDAILRYLYEPTLNIDGIWGGYDGPGAKTILPHMATAKVDSRLPYGIDPEEAQQKIEDYLVEQGFPDVVVRSMEGYPAAQTSVENPLVQAAIGVFNKYGHTPTVMPRLAGSAPFYQFTERLGLPLVFSGLGHGSGAHAPNEYMVIHPREGSTVAGLAEVEKAYVDLLFAVAGQ